MKDHRDKLLAFLDRGRVGTRHSLREMFERIIESTVDPLAIRRWSMHPTNFDSISLWPTNELCDSIISILEAEKCTRILEVGAGTGLLAARISSRLSLLKKSNRSVEIVSSSFQRDKLFPGTAGGLFCKVADQSYAEVSERETPILASFVSDDAGFFAMIDRNQPRFALVIGEAFPLKESKRKNDPYSRTIVPVKMWSQYDHPEFGEKQFAALIYARHKQPALSTAQVEKLIGKSNIGVRLDAADQKRAKLKFHGILT